MIRYPRICPLCAYSANNPAMWTYHKHTHDPIPKGKLCDLGCGQPARIRKTTGKAVCSMNSHQCPAYIKAHAQQVKQQWASSQSTKRRIQLSSRSKSYSPEMRAQQVAKMMITKRSKRLSAESTYDHRKYNRAVVYHTKQTYAKYKQTLNPQDLTIGRQSYHIDHIVSKHVGWLLGIPVDIISSVHNLRLLHYTENGSKACKCSKDPIVLLKQCKAEKQLMEDVKQKMTTVAHFLPAINT